MDRYKKTSLKMDKNLGYGGNLRAVEINTSRAVARNSRFSMQRCLEDEVENSENKPKPKIATLGKQTLKAPMTRLEMLQKWKEEKEMKRKLEVQNKKPNFKIGLSAPKSIPFSKTCDKTDSKIWSMKESRKISYNVTNSSKIAKETCLKAPSTSKFQALPLSSMKLSKSKEPQIPSFNFKPPATQFSNSRIQKESYVQAPNKPKAGLQKPSFVSSKQIKNEEVRQAPMKSQFVPNKPFIAKSKMPPQSTLPKPTESKVFKKQEQVQPSVPRLVQNRIPEPKSSQMQNSGRIIKGPSKIAAHAKPTGIPNKSGIKPKQETKVTKKTEESSKSDISFQCEISHIECEPAEHHKSFAPKDFSFSFLEEGPIAIYTKLKAGEERTSTPKRKEIQEIQEKELKEIHEKELQEIHEKELQEIQEKGFQEIQEKEAEKCLSESGPNITPFEVAEHLLENDVSCIVSKESDVNESLEASEIHCDVIKNSPETQTIEGNSKSENSVINIPEMLPVVIKESQNSSFVAASGSSEEPIENATDVFCSPEVSDPETFEENENATDDILDNLENKIALEKLAAQESIIVLEDKKSAFEENDVPAIEKVSSDPVKQIKATLFEGDVGIISRRRSATRSSNISVRGNRRSEMPQLESISESSENSLLKESPPKPLPIKKSTQVKDFTPRRSLRLARRSEFDTTEDLFNVRPSLHGTPTDDAGISSASNTTNITYDFDKLHLESSKEQPAIPQRRISTRKGNKVSLLYTPPQKGRASSIRKSIKGDLMSFSPDV